MEARRTPGPATLRHHDAVLGCLRAHGFSLPVTAPAYSLLDGSIYGFLLQEVQLPFHPPDEASEVAAAMLARMPQASLPT